MNLKQALQRIKELERRIAALEAGNQVHYHYHTNPTYLPAPLPVYTPIFPHPHRWEPYCSVGSSIQTGLNPPAMQS